MSDQEIPLRYGCNPHQSPARVYCENGKLPIKVLNGNPGYINLLDALNSWQLVRELHGSARPAGRRIVQACEPGRAPQSPFRSPMNSSASTSSTTWNFRRLPPPMPARAAPTACQVSATGPRCPEPCDVATAQLLKREVSDGVIAPGYRTRRARNPAPEEKRQLRASSKSIPPICRRKSETREVFGITVRTETQQCQNNRRYPEKHRHRSKGHSARSACATLSWPRSR